MIKIGILTFHYSNNYGAVIQCLSLQKQIESMGYGVEIINFVPSTSKMKELIKNLGFRKKSGRNISFISRTAEAARKLSIMILHAHSLHQKFTEFRKKELKLSRRVNERSIRTLISEYDVIIAGSDQIWNPTQRKRPYYFLDFGKDFKGFKISYAADSTTSEITSESLDNLKKALCDFYYISVRNEHSLQFVKNITGYECDITADPTVLYDFLHRSSEKSDEKYILVYILGKEIEGSHFQVVKKIKEKYGNLPVYSIKIPTMNFEFFDYADKTFYNAGPAKWLQLIREAAFVYTDSFHGVLFSLKYHRPFLAYYTEKLRETRFFDLGKRYGIEKYLIRNVDEIEIKNSINIPADFDEIDKLLEIHKDFSLNCLSNILRKVSIKR